MARPSFMSAFIAQRPDPVLNESDPGQAMQLRIVSVPSQIPKEINVLLRLTAL